MVISCLLPLHLEVEVKINHKKNYSFFIIRLFRGLIRFKLNFSFASLQEGAISLVLDKAHPHFGHHAKIEEILISLLKKNKTYIKYADGLNHLASKTDIQNLSLNINIGLGDAALTALAYGSIISVYYPLRDYFIKRFKLKSSRLELFPHFNDRRFDVVLNCIFYIKLGHIIIVGFKMLIHSIKGGETSGRTSY